MKMLPGVFRPKIVQKFPFVPAHREIIKKIAPNASSRLLLEHYSRGHFHVVEIEFMSHNSRFKT